MGRRVAKVEKKFLRGINDDVRRSINLNIYLPYFDGNNYFFSHIAAMKIHSFRYCCLEMQVSVSICYPNRIADSFMLQNHKAKKYNVCMET